MLGRLELIRRQVHDAAGDRRDRSAHPQVAPAIGRHRDYARPPEEPPLVDDDRFVLAASLCAARKAAAGPAALPVATSSTGPALSQVRPSRSSGSKTQANFAPTLASRSSTAPGSSPDPSTRSWPAPASKP
jgi:hypothetical protein